MPLHLTVTARAKEGHTAEEVVAAFEELSVEVRKHTPGTLMYYARAVDDTVAVFEELYVDLEAFVQHLAPAETKPLFGKLLGLADVAKGEYVIQGEEMTDAAKAQLAPFSPKDGAISGYLAHKQ